MFLKCFSLALCLFSADALAYQMRSFADIVKKSMHGIVNIRSDVYVRKESGLDLYQFFLGGRVPQNQTNNALGSGIIIDTKGYLVTNFHLIDGARHIEILFADKRRAQANIVGVDRRTDIALLRIKGRHKYQPLSLGNSDKLRIGDLVLAIGNPFGYGHTVTSGIISAKGRVFGSGPHEAFLQTDAGIHPGNSGGPLLDLRGRVIGLNTAVSSHSSAIGFALPVNLLRKVVADLKAFGKVKRVWLGVVGKNIFSLEDIAHANSNDLSSGVIVSNLVVNSPAHQGKLQIGDLLVAINKLKIDDLSHLRRFLEKKKIGDDVTLKIYRRKIGFLNIKLKLMEMPQDQDLPQEDDLF